MEIITAGIPKKDDCPILTRIGAFVVDQNTLATLEYTFRDRNGRPKDLSAYLASSVSESDSSSASSPGGSVDVRVREWVGVPGTRPGPVWQIAGTSPDPASGTLRVELEEELMAQSGIFEMSWGVLNSDGKLVATSQSILSVEHNLFGSYKNARTPGPPTLKEIRMWMMDSSPAENFLTDELEFSDDQLMLALVAPVRQWNETPPPIEQHNTRTFPYRGAWASAALARLYEIAAAYYRKNALQTSGGGVQISDRAKAVEYSAEAKRLQEAYDVWLTNKKVERNMRRFAGQNVSPYSRTGW